MRALTATRTYLVDKEGTDKTLAVLFKGTLILQVVAYVQVILPIVPSS